MPFSYSDCQTIVINDNNINGKNAEYLGFWAGFTAAIN